MILILGITFKLNFDEGGVGGLKIQKKNQVKS
jgi:hypothetical protein